MSEVYLKHPFTMVVSGPTGSGKTFWVLQLIKKSWTASHPAPEKITVCYSEWQPLYDELKELCKEDDTPSVEFIQGVPDNIIERFDGHFPQWLMIDDLMHEAGDSKTVSMLFTKGSHHRNISVVLILQNFFLKSKEMRTISLNAQYLVLFKNPRDKTIITHIGKQVFPGSVKKLQQIFDEVTRNKPYSYIFIDLKPETCDDLRLLQNVLGEGNKPMIAYVL
jgi:hypothetical protein